MCDYCENGKDFGNYDIEACIKNGDLNLTQYVHVGSVAGCGFGREEEYTIFINYCPMCGRKLGDENE